MIKKIILWFFGLLGVALLASHIIFFKVSIMEQAGAVIAKPFLVVADHIASIIQERTQRKRAYAELCKQQEQLKQQYDELFSAYLALRATAEFNEATKELIDFRQRYNFNQAIVAKVLTRTMNENEHTAVLNCGSVHGVKQDMVAIHKLQIIGRVYECYPTTCKLMFMTDKRCKIAGFTNTTSAGGIVAGTNENNHCDMLFVSHLSEIADEDFVFSSGQGLIFPEGFCLGKISKHFHNEKELYHTIYVEPLIDFKELRYCLLAPQDMISLF
ncbi:rod shape-determining protein MreC [Candidatus Dependentiae bacterium]|nr:rod shape-determining protein MreC [Candidatus Dependentiae bacterium]